MSFFYYFSVFYAALLLFTALASPAIAKERSQFDERENFSLLKQFLKSAPDYSIDQGSSLILAQGENHQLSINATISTNAQDLLPVPAKTRFDNPSDSIVQVQVAEETAQSNQPPDQDQDAEDADLRSQSQNPIADLINLPLQNNTDFGVGQFERTRNVLNIQPVIPSSLSDNVLLISRVIVPLVYQPELAPGIGDVFGLGDINPTFFFSPKKSEGVTWGVGPAFAIPTATDDTLGTGKWSIGPSVVAVATREKIVFGALANQIWSFAGDSDREDVSQFLLQPFINYNLANGWFLVSAPIITANWEAPSDDEFTVPIGGGFGRVFALGKQPVNASLQGYWNAVTPDGGADWTLRTQFQLLFPKSSS